MSEQSKEDRLREYRVRFGASIRRIRDSHCQPSYKFAIEAGVDPETYADIEAGREPPYLETVVNLAAAYGPEVFQAYDRYRADLLYDLKAERRKRPVEDGGRDEEDSKELTDAQALEWLHGLKERGYYFECSVDCANSEVVIKRRKSDTKIVTNFRPTIADAVKTLRSELAKMAEDLVG